MRHAADLFPGQAVKVQYHGQDDPGWIGIVDQPQIKTPGNPDCALVWNATYQTQLNRWTVTALHVSHAQISSENVEPPEDAILDAVAAASARMHIRDATRRQLATAIGQLRAWNELRESTARADEKGNTTKKDWETVEDEAYRVLGTLTSLLGCGAAAPAERSTTTK